MGSERDVSSWRKARGCRLCATVVVITVILLFPLQTQVVPRWIVRVVDSSGTPVAGAIVRQQWKYEPFDMERHEGTEMTRKDGFVVFRSRHLRMSLAERGIGLAVGLLRADPHADWGRNSLLVATAPGFEAGEASYRPSESLPAEIRIRRSDGPAVTRVP